MQKLVNLLRGLITVEVTGADPERLINLCASQGVGFWGLEWIDATSFRFTVAFWNWKKLGVLARKAMCELGPPKVAGLPAVLMVLKRRYVFWAGFALFVLALAILPNFILVIDVTGNETVPTPVILSELRRLGVRPGAYGPGLDEKAISNDALISLTRLSFLSVNLYGPRAEVIVREANEIPELRDSDSPCDIISTAPGIVLEVRASAGQALVKPGDTVVAGDTLITGFMDLPEFLESEADLGTYVVHATGAVTARTWRTLHTKLPLYAQIKSYTGQSQSFWSVNFFGNRVKFYQNSGISYDKYDKITTITPLVLPGGLELPFSIIQERARAYSLSPGQLDRDEAITLAQSSLRRELDKILQAAGGECLRADYSAAVDEETQMLTVTLLAECVEQIGKTVPREGSVGFIPGQQVQ